VDKDFAITIQGKEFYYLFITWFGGGIYINKTKQLKTNSREGLS